MPTAVYNAHAAYAANVNKSYVFGGLNGLNQGMNTTQIYDVTTNTWTTGAPMPAARFWPNVVYYSGNGKIYVIGGFDSGFNEQGQTWQYDPVTNTWNTSRASDPVPQGAANATISGQFVYLAGGSINGSTTHYRYDIVSDTWAQMAFLPVPNREAGSGNIDGKNYLFGGGNPFFAGPGNFKSKSNVNAPATTYISTYIYDIASNSWTTGPNLNVPHSAAGGTAIGNRLLIVAGYNGTTDTDTVETTTVCGANVNAYTQPTPAPMPRGD
jgi:N-acetylneuraminic acid mutarotase